MSKINFDACETNFMNKESANEYFLKDVEETISKKSKNRMWVCHFVPVVNKAAEMNDYGKYPDELTEYVVFDNKNNITNVYGISKWCNVLAQNGMVHIGKVLQEALEKKHTCWVLTELKEETYNGKTYYKDHPVEFWRKKPSEKEIKELQKGIKEKDEFNKKLTDSVKAGDDEDELPFD